jgi:transcriptional regulator with XRE-family HTH domain
VRKSQAKTQLIFVETILHFDLTNANLCVTIALAIVTAEDLNVNVSALPERLLELRKGYGISQMELSKVLGLTQAATNRYEHGQTTIPAYVVERYANYFDVSADYLLGRTDNPEGKLFKAKPEFLKDNEQLRQFIEMCFDPSSTASTRLKNTLYEMMTNGEDNK